MAANYCSSCGEKITPGAGFCPACGEKIGTGSPQAQGSRTASQFGDQSQAHASPNHPEPSPRASGDSTKFLVGGFLSAVVAIFLLPIVFGPIGIYCGYKAREEGSDAGGIAIIALSLVTMIFGMIVGAIIGASIF